MQQGSSASLSDVGIAPDDHVVQDMLERTLAYARRRDYIGWDYGDGMHNQIRDLLPGEHKWLNIGFQEAVKRVPVNIRPLLGVKQRRNYKGAALFTMANQTTARLFEDLDTAELLYPTVDYRAETDDLASWLVENRSRGYSGFCGGYPHPIQHLDGLGQPNEPDIVDTSFAVKALLRAGEMDLSYAEACETAGEFVHGDLRFRLADDGTGAVVDYHTKHEQDYYTPNAGALCARLFLDLYAHFGDESHRESAEQLLDHIAELQTDRGGWYYRDPPEASHLSMDTHHNGFIIECYQRYRAVTGDDRYDETLSTALDFFRRDLFEENGAPMFEEDTPYPRDIHASTQGVLVFTYAGDHRFARQILQWVFENLHAGDGQFYYRKERFYTKRHTLMRWCQAWMAYAMAEYLAARRDPTLLANNTDCETGRGQ